MTISILTVFSDGNSIQRDFNDGYCSSIYSPERPIIKDYDDHIVSQQ